MSFIRHPCLFWLFCYNQRYQDIMKRRLIDGICFEPLADEFDMSVRQIKNIVYKLEKKVFRHLI